jgi:hypothetical protein
MSKAVGHHLDTKEGTFNFLLTIRCQLKWVHAPMNVHFVLHGHASCKAASICLDAKVAGSMAGG